MKNKTPGHAPFLRAAANPRRASDCHGGGGEGEREWRLLAARKREGGTRQERALLIGWAGRKGRGFTDARRSGAGGAGWRCSAAVAGATLPSTCGTSPRGHVTAEVATPSRDAVKQTPRPYCQNCAPPRSHDTAKCVLLLSRDTGKAPAVIVT